MTKAAWRRAFDSTEGAAAPRLERLVREPAFRTTVVVVRRTTAFAQGLVEAGTRSLWHAVNLPTATDVRKLRRQIGALDREVRLLQELAATRSRGRDGATDQ